MHVEGLEPELQEALLKKDLGTMNRVYFNKGL